MRTKIHIGEKNRRETTKEERIYKKERKFDKIDPHYIIESVLQGKNQIFMEVAIMSEKKPIEGWQHMVSFKNTDRIKAEVAHHNPDNLNPDEMLNWILDQYFRFVERARK